ncbi:MAG: GreA/GreB family elongation factor [Patescibacteria group bacterium]
MPKDNYYLTPEGLENIKEELKEIKEEKLPQVREDLRRAQEDEAEFSENFAYTEALQERDQLEDRLEELQHVLRNHEVIEYDSSCGKVALGATVTVEVEGEEDEFKIVGSLEADPAEGKISHESPVGSSLLGEKPGSVVEVSGSVVKATYKILSVS